MKNKILVNVWGYSMTIVDFYKVVAETPKTVTLRKLKNVDTATGYLSGTTIAGESFYDEKEYKAVMREEKNGEKYFVSSMGGSVRHYLREWNGQPKHFNHCD